MILNSVTITNLRWLGLFLFLFLFFTSNVSVSLANDKQAEVGSQILVTVGNRDITSTELEQLIGSSPVGIQFNTMDEDMQAMIRGRMLKNLIYSEMVYQEALAQKVDQRQEVKDELEEFRQNLLYQRYQLSLRSLLKSSTDQDARLKQRLQDEPQALAAARSASKSGKFLKIKAQRTLELGKQDHLVVYEKPLQPGNRNPKAIVAKSDHILIHLEDLIYGDVSLQTIDPESLMSRLDSEIEHRLMSYAAARDGIDVSEQLNVFKRDLIREIFMREREKSWVPNRAAMQAYYDAHPELSRVAEQWHIGQLIVASDEEAQALRQQIIAGESLFRLAAEKSIDPYGRQQAGDMGWVRPDQAPESLTSVLQTMPDNEISPVIKTQRGYHIVTILGRKPGYQKPLNAVADGIRRSMILENMSKDYVALSARYPIQWHLQTHKNSAGQ